MWLEFDKIPFCATGLVNHSSCHRAEFTGIALLAETDQLVVLRLNEVGWSDLGDPGRAFMAARESSCEPDWMEDWGRAKAVAFDNSEEAAAIA